jgi:hypothetical protein
MVTVTTLKRDLVPSRLNAVGRRLPILVDCLDDRREVVQIPTSTSKRPPKCIDGAEDFAVMIGAK